MTRTKQTARKSTWSRPPRQMAAKSGYYGGYHDDDEDEDEEDLSMDMDSLDEGNSDSGEKKQASGPKDLRDELNAVFEGNFHFEGSFYSAESISSAPNPCLKIDGIGTVGVPLSDRDARAIIQVAAQAPFGHGTETVIDTNVRNTWEIEPKNIRFGNPAWKEFIETMVVDSVLTGLGVASPTSTPICELYKLLLYETGSHFLPHQDTQKAPGMFATVIVLLPSYYEGGQVHVSHGSEKEIIDLSSNSDFTTSVLSWYTDVTHEVKPITSGYRLALSYNLIHTSEPESIPHIPEMNDAVVRVRTVLEKWRQPPYKHEKRKKNLLAYVLQHQYNIIDLKKGANSLKGEDAQLVAHVKIAAEEVGYVTLLGALQYYLQGAGDDDGAGAGDGWGNGGGWGSRRWGYNDNQRNEDDVKFSWIDEREVKVENLVDFEGRQVIGEHTLYLREENLVPKDPFKDEEPDHREYAGYMGNGAGSLEHWYRRTVLIIVHKDDLSNILMDAGGLPHALSKLQQINSDQPDEEGKRIMEYLIRNLTSHDAHIAEQTLQYALRWKSLTYWKEIVEKWGNTLETFKTEELLAALQTFTFKQIRSSFDILLEQGQPLKNKLEFINAMRSPAKPGKATAAITTWCNGWEIRALKSINSPTIDDIPTLINAAERYGTPFLSQDILPQLARFPERFDVIVNFTKSAYEGRDAIPISNDQDIVPVDWDTFMTECIGILVKRCEQLQIYNPAAYYGFTVNRAPVKEEHLNMYLEVINICVMTGILGPCQGLLQRLLNIPGDVETKFTIVYQPFVTQLIAACKQHGFDPIIPPIDDFLRRLISTYLHSILGISPSQDLSKVRNLGCGCPHCNDLDRFINNPTQAFQNFPLVQAQRTHLEKRIKSANDLVTFETIYTGRPHTLRVTKQEGVLTAQKWAARLADAKAFLAIIGDFDTIARLMGDRYPAVHLALQGIQRFAEIPTTINPPTASGAPTNSGTVAGANPPPVVAPRPRNTARKRKGPEVGVEHDVIDLT